MHRDVFVWWVTSNWWRHQDDIIVLDYLTNSLNVIGAWRCRCCCCQLSIVKNSCSNWDGLVHRLNVSQDMQNKPVWIETQIALHVQMHDSDGDEATIILLLAMMTKIHWFLVVSENVRYLHQLISMIQNWHDASILIDIFWIPYPFVLILIKKICHRIDWI